MFKFGSKESEKQKKDYAEWRTYIPAAINNTFGTNDPEKINEIWRKYMPEITNAILETKRAALNNEKNIVLIGENQMHINENINSKYDELMTKLNSLEQQNKELQAKYDVLVERMAGYIERENGKGR